MKTLTEHAGQPVTIVTPSAFKSSYNIVIGESVVGNLCNKNFWGNIYSLTMFGKEWEVYTPSVWKGKIEIRETGKELPLAYYEGNGLRHSGVFYLPQGERVSLVFNSWKSFYELRNERQDLIAHFKNKSFWCSTIIVTLGDATAVLEKYPFLLLFAYHIAVKRQQAAVVVVH